MRRQSDPRRSSGRPSTLKRFLREVQVTATLTHPNTVQIFDYGQADDGTVFYAMEYLPGLNLQRLVEQYGRLDPRRAVHILRQLCSALAEAHAIGLIHRDIKPTNVILCSRGGVDDVAKLLDFGLVRLQAADPAQRGVTQVGLIFGTPAYMSPEQASGKQELDARSDIYSLAALAFFLLAGEPPFVRNGVVQTLAAHMSEDVPFLRSRRPELSQELEALVKTCLAKDPDMRLQTVIDLDKELSKCELASKWTQAEAREWWLATVE
jgi:eukaryotic-like serine/threonine-protein kinase